MARLGMVLYHGIDSGLELQHYGRIAEATGFESLWVTERYFHEETFALLGYLAAVTQRTRLGLAVTNPYTRHPALLGMASATLDRLCGGRFLLGLGRSERGVIQDRLGLPYRTPRATLADTVAVLRRLFAGDQVTTSGGHSTLHNVRLAIQPVQQPLPIYLAAIGPHALRLAGMLADGVVLNAYVPPAYVRYAVAEIRQAAQAAGRPPEAITITCMLVVRLTEDPAALWPGLKQRLVRLLAEPSIGEILLDKGGFDAGILPALRAAVAEGRDLAAVEWISDAMVEAFYLVGSAARCRARIAEYRQAGVDVPLLLPRLHDFQQVAVALGEG